MDAIRRGGLWRAALTAPLLIAVAGCTTHPTAPAELTDGAQAYREGRFADAELIWLEALAKSEKYGDEDPRLAQSLHMLANLAVQQERYDEAVPLYERWIDVRERGLHPEDAVFADGLEALAGVHMVEGHHAAAVPLYERALAVRENDTSMD
ncbi:MAG: tetratricopeptide repeat protein, partial [Myxococcota bacterium]